MGFGTDVQSFWNSRPSQKDTKRFEDPEDLLRSAFAYFAWIDDHPLKEAQLFHYKGAISEGQLNKMRPYTINGLAVFLGLAVSSLHLYRKDPVLKEAMEYIENVIYTQKFEGAAAGLLNSGLIARDLGLADKAEITGANGGPIETKELSARELLAQKLAALAPKDAAAGTAGEPE